MPPVISIVGKSGSGKTTLIENLVPVFKRMGLRVGTIKHDAHRFEIDREGKDSYRHFHSGSDVMVIASGDKLALVKRLEKPVELDDIVAMYHADADIVVTEGYKANDKPKIEVWRREVSQAPLLAQHENLVAVATNDSIDTTRPILKLDDYAGIARFILLLLKVRTPQSVG